LEIKILKRAYYYFVVINYYLIDWIK